MKLKESKVVSSTGFVIIILVILLIVTVVKCIGLFNISKNDDCSNIVFNEYVTNLKNYMIQQESEEIANGYIRSAINAMIYINDDEDSTNDELKVYLNLKTQEVYINFIDEDKFEKESDIKNQRIKNLYKKYGSKYKIADGIIDIITDIQMDNVYIYMLRDNGSIIYIDSEELIDGNVIVKELNIPGNIIQFKEKISGGNVSDMFPVILAIDIQGNVYEVINYVSQFK